MARSAAKSERSDFVTMMFDFNIVWYTKELGVEFNLEVFGRASMWYAVARATKKCEV